MYQLQFVTDLNADKIKLIYSAKYPGLLLTPENLTAH